MKRFYKISVLSLLAGLSLGLTACGSSSGSNGNSAALGAGAIGSCQNPQEYTLDQQVGLCCFPETQISELSSNPYLCEPTLTQGCQSQNAATPYAQLLGFNGSSPVLTCIANPY
jgi:hypothetical protein